MIRELATCLVLLVGSSAATAAEVSLRIEEPAGVARKQWPVTSGIPFGKGELKDIAEAALFAPDGEEIALQTEALCRWPDGSVRWLLLDFMVDLAERQKKTLVLRYGPGTRRAAVSRPVAARRDENGVSITTGPLLLKLSAAHFRLLDAVWLDRDGDGKFSDAERVTRADGAGIVLTTPDGEQFVADLAKADMVIEQAGPIRACVRISGRHVSRKGTRFRYVARLHAYRGQPFVRLDYTFINDFRDEMMTRIDSLDLVFALREAAGTSYFLDGKPSGPGRLFQVDDRSYEIDGKPAGVRATGWAAQGNDAAGLAIGVRDFWQNWPKALEQRPGELRVGICPHFPKGTYDGKPLEEESRLYYYLRGGAYTFKVGVARTQELWATFFCGKPEATRLTAFFRASDTPLLAQCTPSHVSATKAMGSFPPADPKKYAGYDAWMQAFFETHLADRERVREYGFLNYGDWYNTAWEEWGNLEYDTARIWFLQYLRTGDRRFFDRAEQAARYHIDVDVCHAVNPQVQDYPGSWQMRPGQIWAHAVGHTGGYYGQWRNGNYVNMAPLKMVGPQQVGFYDFGHTWIGGAFDYYMLTGDRRAYEIGVFVSDTMAELCPTRYSDHIRGIGWPMHLLINAFEATLDKKYLDAAAKEWQVLKKNLDPKKGWVVMLAYGHCSEPAESRRCRGNNMYMLGFTLTALARYHRLTNDPEVLQGLSAGIDQMIREAWSEKHKSFYLTSCRHAMKNPPRAYCSATFHASEAFVYEAALTGNEEHRRIIAAALRTAIAGGVRALAAQEPRGQTGYYSGSFHFAPFGLSALTD